MGSEVVIITKNEIVSGDVKLSRFELLPDRGFGSFIMNAKFKEKPVINELERILQHNVDFLLEPEYYDPNIHGYEAVMGSTISNAAPVRGFVKIDAFIENLEKLQDWIYTDHKIRPGAQYPLLKEGEMMQEKFKNLDEAKSKLLETLKEYLIYFRENPQAEKFHPRFGLINKEMSELFQRKHFTHHFEQFGLVTR